MDKKIVFFDIDGTLLDHDKKLPDSTRLAIKELQETGVFVAIATGRAPFMFEPLRKQLDIDTFVSFNGQFVVFEGEVIYRNPLCQTGLERLTAKAKSLGIPLVYMNESTMKASVRSSERIEEAMASLRFPHPEMNEVFYTDSDIFQSLLFCTEEEEKSYTDSFPEFHFIRWHPYSIDVLPHGGSKAEGIKILMERVGFKLEDVYAFGDGLNDIEMIKTVGYGIAMGNAGDALKEHAYYVTRDVAEDGILHGLKEMKLIK
ncbi:Cof-type HAD-IIB family hydrolase [Peribacillus saganii]|uniref:Cof-type HAD-IIB family hydrolase n=1 Tax=Peribacillus saganii TaxID=2303992 RepID=A0A372LTH5_9BACI|nr:Cof-type HAD-IIB family hydrolase [Peribacillus saganii]RFU71102.1 Cof-type HAD-IIB family hydrolase [Peribacillus saganii]